MSQDQETPSDCVFAQDTDETRRLQHQTEFFSRFIQGLLDAAGITSGMQVLVSGPGFGDVAFLVAERVGPQGTVVGVDMDPATIDVARQRAQAAGITNVAFLQEEFSQMVLSDRFDAVMYQDNNTVFQITRRAPKRMEPDLA